MPGGRRTYRARAVVLDRTKLGEQDLILTLLSEDGSQLRAVAKGARKPGGRLAARAELFSEDDFLLARGRSLDVVSEASLLEPHARLRGDYERVSAASAVAEVARLTCYEDAPD
ncbi:DNA repair protein RecO, partial [Thermophilibacter provencensis]